MHCYQLTENWFIRAFFSVTQAARQEVGRTESAEGVQGGEVGTSETNSLPQVCRP